MVGVGGSGGMGEVGVWVRVCVTVSYIFTNKLPCYFRYIFVY